MRGEYRPEFGPADFDRVKAAVLQCARAAAPSSVSANDVLAHVLLCGATDDAREVAQMLRDLTDLDQLELDGGRWRARPFKCPRPAGLHG